MPLCQLIPPSPSLLCVHESVLCVCVSVAALQYIHQYHFSRFHIYVFMYSICFSLSDLLHSV